jgi:hypothetical protein
MVGVLHCGFVAQRRSELASLSPKRAIYSQRRALGSWRGNDTARRDNGTCSLCIIKGNDITLSDSRRLCCLCINDA